MSGFRFVFGVVLLFFYSCDSGAFEKQHASFYKPEGHFVVTKVEWGRNHFQRIVLRVSDVPEVTFSYRFEEIYRQEQLSLIREGDFLIKKSNTFKLRHMRSGKVVQLLKPISD
jgi:hypothetical protein